MVGYRKLHSFEFIDQASDHAHFHTLHNEFYIPYTTILIPSFVFHFFPIAIQHELQTYRGNESEWKEICEEKLQGRVCHDSRYLFFTDKAGTLSCQVYS
jgi:hypothetical protein